MNEFGAAADVMTGAVIAGAVEPAGASVVSETRSDCLNCGAALAGAHCHNCGQKAKVHRTLHAFGHDFLHSVLHFDGKIWRTLPMLFWRPGDLTRRYVHGERVKFVSPLALFLFVVFLTFAAFNTLMPAESETNIIEVQSSEQKAYDANRRGILDSIAELEKDKQEAIAVGQTGYQWMDGAIARHKRTLQSLDEGQGKELRRRDIAVRKLAAEKDKIETSIAKLEADLVKAEKAGLPSNAIKEQLEGERLGVKVLGKAAELANSADPASAWTVTDPSLPGAGWLNQAFKHASSNPQLLIYKIQSNTYKYSWVLIPISVPFVWLLFFWRRKFKLFDHAVFVTYSLTFMMLLGTISAILFQFSQTEIIGGLAFTLVPPIHMYRQLHQAYETSRFGAFWRMCALTLFALTALTLFAILVFTLGVTG
jgi:hypothetical protein